MAKMNSKHKYMYDAAPSVALIPQGPAETASFLGNVYVLDKLDGYWNTQGEVADIALSMILNVVSVDHTTGDEAYSFVIEASADNFATSKVVGTIASAVPAAGQYVTILDVDTVVAEVPGVTALRVRATLGGTSPSITCFAFIGDIQAG